MTSIDSCGEKKIDLSMSRKLLIAIILLAATVIYLPISGQDLHSDDFQRVYDNAQLSTDYFKNLLIDNKVDGFYRPLNHLSFGLTYHFFGLNPYPYGVFNFLLVLCTGYLIFEIAARLTRDRVFGALVAIGWLVNVKVVLSALTWAVGRTTGMEVLFGLCAVQLILMAGKWNVVLCLVLATFSMALALFSKESAVVSAVFVLAAIFYMKTQTRRVGWAHIISLAAMLALLYVIYFSLRSYTAAWSPKGAPSYYAWEFAPTSLIRNAFICFQNSLFLSVLLLPLFWLLTRRAERSPALPKNTIGAIAFCIIGFGICMAPMLALPATSTERFYRYAYAPSIFVVAGLVLLLRHSSRWTGFISSLRSCVWCLVAVSLAAAPLAWWNGYKEHLENRHTLEWMKTVQSSLGESQPPAIAIKDNRWFFLKYGFHRDDSEFKDLQMALELKGIKSRIIVNPEDLDPDRPCFEVLPGWPRFEFRHIYSSPVLGVLIALESQDSLSRRIWITMTQKDGGKDVAVGETIARYWEGKGHKTPIALSYGATRKLSAGRYSATFRYRAEIPRRVYKDTWGQFGVYAQNARDPLARAEIQRTAAPSGVFITQVVPFETTANGNVEIRIMGGDAPLWLESVQFARR